MFEWLGRIFATDKSIESGLSMIEKAGDALVYTDEEKATARDNMIKHKDTMITNWIESSKSANLARRFLAVLVSCIWSFLLMFSWASQQFAVWTSSIDAEKIRQMKDINDPFLEQATGGMMLVLAFYFAAPYMGAIVEGAMSKFSGAKK